MDKNFIYNLIYFPRYKISINYKLLKAIIDAIDVVEYINVIIGNNVINFSSTGIKKVCYDEYKTYNKIQILIKLYQEDDTIKEISLGNGIYFLNFYINTSCFLLLNMYHDVLVDKIREELLLNNVSYDVKFNYYIQRENVSRNVNVCYNLILSNSFFISNNEYYMKDFYELLNNNFYQTGTMNNKDLFKILFVLCSISHDKTQYIFNNTNISQIKLDLLLMFKYDENDIIDDNDHLKILLLYFINKESLSVNSDESNELIIMLSIYDIYFKQGINKLRRIFGIKTNLPILFFIINDRNILNSLSNGIRILKKMKIIMNDMLFNSINANKKPYEYYQRMTTDKNYVTMVANSNTIKISIVNYYKKTRKDYMILDIYNIINNLGDILIYIPLKMDNVNIEYLDKELYNNFIEIVKIYKNSTIRNHILNFCKKFE